MKALLDWLDDRTGLVSARKERRQAGIPRQPCCLGVLPSTIVFTVCVEAVTGFFLWAFYSPSAQTAWESLYYLQYEVAGGWLLRGIHYHAGQVLLALIGLYVLTLIFSGAYRAPRELVFWLAVGMAVVTIALLLTGDLLSWSQRGYWSTDVRTKFLFLLPWVGGDVYKLAVGGPGIGHLTLTRFVALHAGLLSAVLVGLLALHGCWARRAARKAACAEESPVAPHPHAGRLGQALRDSLACAAVMAVVLVMCCWGAVAGAPGDQLPGGQLPGDYLGAELGSPPDPGDAYAAARPDWYFVGLYQFAHYFSGAWKIVPIFLVPKLLILYLLAMPFVARCRKGHRVNVAVTVALGAALVVLTGVSKYRDATDEGHQASLAAAEQDAVRVKQLIRAQGIPSGGAMTLLWEDPKTQGPKLFKQLCASCHDHADAEGSGILAQDPTAPNLHRFAGVEWLTGFLDAKQIGYVPPADEQTGKPKCTPTDRPRYYGATEKLKKEAMVEFVKGNLKELRKDVGQEEFRKMIETLAAEATRKAAAPLAKEAQQAIEDFTCLDCHRFHGQNKAPSAPDLTGYGSREWVIGVISDPASNRFYGKNNERMPSYAKSPDKPEENVLSARQIELLADWLRGVWFEPEPSTE